MSGFKPKSHEGEPIIREDHQPPIFLVAPYGYGQLWVSCPVCCARPDGWDGEGRTRYTGGSIDIMVSSHRGPGTKAVAACKCAAGRLNSERAPHVRVLPFDEHPPNVEFITVPAPILFINGKSKGSPPPELPIFEEAKYTAAHAAQMRRFQDGKLTREQWLANCKALDDRHLPAKITGPTISDLLAPHGESMRDLYFHAFSRKVEWRGPTPAPAVGHGKDFNERGERDG